MSDWKKDSVDRRDERATKVSDAPTPSGKKKDTRSWCKGKVGREHQSKCVSFKEIKGWGQDKYRLLICTECGKDLEIYYGRGDKPSWVNEKI